MPLIDDPVIKMMENVLGFANLRHEVVSANLANVNTPGYRAFDVVLRAQLDGGTALEPGRTNPRHMAAEAPGSPSGAELKESGEPARLDGNNVNLDDELTRMLENRVLYQAAMELRDRWANLKVVAREVR